MNRNFNRQFTLRQRCLTQQVQKAGSTDFFNLLTSPQLLETVEALLPEYRERRYSPTATLAMFLGQVLRADGSCQNAVNEAIVERLLSWLPAGSASTGGYCLARQRLPEEMVSALARQTASLLTAHTPSAWRWRGRHVKMVDGTTILMPDSRQNQMHYPQQSHQAPGAGFPLARLVGVISLAHGAVLEVAMGPYQGKGTGEHGLFRDLKNHGIGKLLIESRDAFIEVVQARMRSLQKTPVLISAFFREPNLRYILA